MGHRPDLVCDGRRRVALVDLIIAGFTGRNRAKVQEHIDEMRAHGVPIPDAVPTFYPGPEALLLRGAERIEVDSPETTGEVELVLIQRDGGEWFATLGSDHTDRGIEKTDIALSKAACPKIVCTEEWPFAEVRPHWDRLELRGWAAEAGKRLAYQHGTAADIMEPERLVDILRERIPHLHAAFTMCMGTLPLLGGKFVYAPRYEFELHDPVLGRTLRIGYDVTLRAH